MRLCVIFVVNVSFRFVVVLGDDDRLSTPPPHLRSIAEREHLRAMEAAHHVMEEAKKRMEEAHRVVPPPLLPPPMIPFSKVYVRTLHIFVERFFPINALKTTTI